MGLGGEVGGCRDSSLGELSVGLLFLLESGGLGFWASVWHSFELSGNMDRIRLMVFCIADSAGGRAVISRLKTSV